jgi:hypothetical protein
MHVFNFFLKKLLCFVKVHYAKYDILRLVLYDYKMPLTTKNGIKDGSKSATKHK